MIYACDLVCDVGCGGVGISLVGSQSIAGRKRLKVPWSNATHMVYKGYCLNLIEISRVLK